MNKPDSANVSFMAKLYIRGPAMDPSYISSLLGIQPDHEHRSGDYNIVKGKVYAKRKDSLWVVGVESESDDFDDLVFRFYSKCKPVYDAVERDNVILQKIDGVKYSYIDFFILRCEDSEVYFVINNECLEILSRLRVPLHFTAIHMHED